MTDRNENKKGYKKTKLGWIPQEWGVKKLGDCCKEPGKYGICAAAVDFSKNLPRYLRITDIDNNGHCSLYSKASVNEFNYEKFILKDGDIVFVRTGATVGKTYLYNKKDGLLVYAGFLIKFTPDNSILKAKYLNYVTLLTKY